MKPYVLVVDDEPDICVSVKDILEDEGYAVAVAENGEAARRLVRQKVPDIILLDIWMPDVDGISLLKEFMDDMAINVPVVMMSGHGTVETAVEATRVGAKDFIEKPLSLAKLLHTVERVLEEAKNEAPLQSMRTPIQVVAPVGKSVQMQLLREHLEKIAQHGDRVLMHGETGSGKTFCARYIHARSPRHSGSFVDVHTKFLRDGQGAALLFGKEVLGREVLAQDAAGKIVSNAKIMNGGSGGDDESNIIPGFLDQAQGGTLYLDDIAELDADIQQSLHAALSTGQWVRVNGGKAIPLNVQIIAATRYDLMQEIRAGRFREDLFHFLNVVPVFVPALREHVEDVTELLHYFVDMLVDKEGLPYRNFTVAAQNRLRHYDWPGNIRELEGLVRRLLVLGLDMDVELNEVEAALSTAAPLSNDAMALQFDLPLRQAREQFERAYLEYHLQQAGGSVGKMSKLVGMERTNLYRKLRALGIDARRISS